MPLSSPVALDRPGQPKAAGEAEKVGWQAHTVARRPPSTNRRSRPVLPVKVIVGTTERDDSGSRSTPRWTTLRVPARLGHARQTWCADSTRKRVPNRAARRARRSVRRHPPAGRRPTLRIALTGPVGLWARVNGIAARGWVVRGVWSPWRRMAGDGDRRATWPATARAFDAKPASLSSSGSSGTSSTWSRCPVPTSLHGRWKVSTWPLSLWTRRHRAARRGGRRFRLDSGPSTCGAGSATPGATSTGCSTVMASSPDQRSSGFATASCRSHERLHALGERGSAGAPRPVEGIGPGTSASGVLGQEVRIAEAWRDGALAGWMVGELRAFRSRWTRSAGPG